MNFADTHYPAPRPPLSVNLPGKGRSDRYSRIRFQRTGSILIPRLQGSGAYNILPCKEIRSPPYISRETLVRPGLKGTRQTAPDQGVEGIAVFLFLFDMPDIAAALCPGSR